MNSKPKMKTLNPELLNKMDAYWRAANYLSVGQIYLYDNPLLKQPLKLSHVKPTLLGHWGTTPGPSVVLRMASLIFAVILGGVPFGRKVPR